MKSTLAMRFPLSIRGKVIFPYLILTLLVAITGTFVVTRLVSKSLSERLTNQLLEAGRVVSDGLARREIKHLEIARIVAYTRGLSEALATFDKGQVAALAEPVAFSLEAENLIVIDSKGQEAFHLLKRDSDTYQQLAGSTGANGLPFVQELLSNHDPNSLPKRALGLHPVDLHYYYFTAIPISQDGQITGVVVVGTSLQTILPYLKSTSLADVIFYSQGGNAIATTLPIQEEKPDWQDTLSIPSALYEKILTQNGTVSGENFSIDGHWYSLARGPIRVGDERLGDFAVVLPLNFVLQAGTTSRNTYAFMFSFAAASVVLLGYWIARRITHPLSLLVRTSRAIAEGDLNQRTGLQSKDEIGILANTFDEMTDRLVQRTNELEKAYHALEQMDKTKSTFINVAAHELRTPLTLVKGYTQIMQQMTNHDPGLDAVTQGIIGGADRMHEIVNNMLDVSKIDSQTLEVLPQPIELSSITEEVQKGFQKALSERHLILHSQGLETLPLIHADPDLIQKVFYHLIMNAIKYTPDGGFITITGRSVAEDEENPEIEVTVSDTGIGIDPQHHELIFEKFYQTGEVMVHSSGKTNFKCGGPGLGLAIARGIIQAHHGRIWVESSGCDEKAFPGSRFYLRLPVNGASG